MTQGRIMIDSERCKGCELCITVCPQHVLAMSAIFNSIGYRPAQLADPSGLCTGCAVCALICPDTAITVYRQGVKEPRAKNQEPAGSACGSQLSALGSSARSLA